MKTPNINLPSVSLPPRLQKVLKVLGKYVGYPLFFLFCFVLFAYWTFPYERVKAFVIQQVENPMNGRTGTREPSGYQLEIVDLSPSWFTGVELTGVTLTKLPEDPEEPALPVTFESIEARIGLMALIFGSYDVDFSTRVGGGDIEGEVSLSETTNAVDVRFDGVQLRRIGPLRSMIGLPVRGELDGTIAMVITEEAADTTGEIDLSIEGLSLGDGVAKLRLDVNAFTRAGLTVQETDFGDFELEMSMEGGSANVTKLQSRGEDIQLDGAGTVQVRNTMITSSIDAMMRIGISEEYREENAGLFMAIDNEPRVRAAKTSDGAMQFHIVGNIGPRLRFQGAANAPRPGAE